MSTSISTPFCCCRLGKNGQKKKKKEVRFMSQIQLSPPDTKMVTTMKVEDLQSSRSIQSVYETARTSVEETPRDDNYRKFPSMTDLIREIRMEEGLAVTDRSIDNQSLPSTSFSSTSTNSSSTSL